MVKTNNQIMEKLEEIERLIKEIHKVERMGCEWQELKQPVSEDSAHAN